MLLTRVALSASLAFASSPASTQGVDRITELQQSIARQQQQIEAVQGAINDMQAENGLLKEMLKNILATQESMRAAAIVSAIPPDQRATQLKPRVESAKKEADAAVEAFSKIPDEVLGQKLKQRITNCITATKGSAERELASVPPDPLKVVRASSEED